MLPIAEDGSLEADLQACEARLLNLQKLTAGPDDHRPAFFVIKAGGGGREAEAWAQMLIRMYARWIDRLGLSSEIVDITTSTDGVRSATISIPNAGAYGKLKTEQGIHRLSRVSPFDQADRRQTSFASIEVISEVEYKISEPEIDVHEEDIDVSTCRGGGAGGLSPK